MTPHYILKRDFSERFLFFNWHTRSLTQTLKIQCSKMFPLYEATLYTETRLFRKIFVFQLTLFPLYEYMKPHHTLKKRLFRKTCPRRQPEADEHICRRLVGRKVGANSNNIVHIVRALPFKERGYHYRRPERGLGGEKKKRKKSSQKSVP